MLMMKRMKCNNLISVILLLVSNNWHLVGIAPAVAAADGGSVADESSKTGVPDLFDNDVFASHLLMGDQIALTADVSANLVFLPKLIDFQRVPIGEPQSRVITVFNRHTNQSVFLGSIIGNVPDFYTSYFSDTKVVIPPEGKRMRNRQMTTTTTVMRATCVCLCACCLCVVAAAWLFAI